MNLNRLFGLICLIISQAIATPVQLPNDVFADFLRSTPSKNSVVVKRRIFEDNADRQLKQISLSSLVGDLEKNIFASALSLDKALTRKNDSELKIKVGNDSEHGTHINNDQSFAVQEINRKSAATKTTTTNVPSANFSITDEVVLQTTEEFSQTNGEPTHIIIDHIAIQPHTGGTASIPIFELKKQIRNGENSNKNNEATNITTSKTVTTNLATEWPDFSTISSSNFSAFNSTTMREIATTEGVLKSVTTPKDIEDLKEAEKELKEKFAEIEAEPVILSARV